MPGMHVLASAPEERQCRLQEHLSHLGSGPVPRERPAKRCAVSTLNAPFPFQIEWLEQHPMMIAASVLS